MNELVWRWFLKVYFFAVISHATTNNPHLDAGKVHQNCTITPSVNPEEKECTCGTFRFLLTLENNFIVTCFNRDLLTYTAVKLAITRCNYTMPTKLKDLVIRKCQVVDFSFVQILTDDNAESTINKISIDNFQNIGHTVGSQNTKILASVQQLTIRNSNFVELPESLLEDMPNLKIFRMYNCSTNALSGELFKPVNNLVELSLRSNNITSLENNAFRFVTNVTNLSLSDNHLQEIPVDIFTNLRQLIVLDLSYNKLERLDAGIFRHLRRLERLNLTRNNFDELPSSLLSDTPNLINIALSDACTDKMSRLPAAFFANLTSLVEMHSDSNHFVELPADLFENCTRLRVVSLKDNSLVALPSTIFRDTVELRSLDLSDNKLRNTNRCAALPADLFQNCARLKQIYLAKNSLNALSDFTFGNTASLTTLDLSDNQVEFLNNTIFESLSDLEVLKLAGNRLRSIDENLFASLKSLRELDLSRNQLKDFRTNSFRSLENLYRLDLSHNQLTLEQSLSRKSTVQIHRKKNKYESPFQACGKLKHLNLKNNSLGTIFDDWKRFENLEKLDLSLNQFQSLTSQDILFQKRCHTVHINLSENRIKTIKIGDFEQLLISDDTLLRHGLCAENNPSIIRFDLANNSIVCDCDIFHASKYLQNEVLTKAMIKFDHGRCYSPDFLQNISLYFVPLDKIKCPLNSTDVACPQNCTCWHRPANRSIIVDCTGANLHAFPPSLLSLYNVTLELEFANNSIESLNELSNLSSSVKITKFSLSFNKLRTIDYLRIPNGLEVLELDNNQLSNLNDAAIAQLNASETLTSITLHNNPWLCNCESQPLLRLLHWKIQQGKLHISNMRNIKCRQNGNPMIHSLHHNFCESFVQRITHFVYIATFTVAFALTIIISVSIYRVYRYEIKVWLFSHKLFSWLVTETEIDKTKPYDAFVSYSSKDESFVVEQLIPMLENSGEHRFKLCIHYRDFVVGEYIPDQIVKAVEDARRTIFLLSSNFLESVWTRMEFRVAHLKTIKERHARVIIILLDEIKTENLDSELKNYITMHTYLKWGDPWFWEKLRYALPHPETSSKRR